MGVVKILWVREDGIRIKRDDLPECLGKAVLDVCMHGEKYGEVFGHTNCVNYCDEIHSTDTQVYLWVQNCLRPIHMLDDDRLNLAAKLIEDLKKQRKQVPE